MLGAGAEHRQQVRRHADRADALGLAVAGQVLVAADRERDLLEPAVARPDVEVLRGREPVLHDAEARRAVPEDDEAVGIRVGQRAQQERAGDAEDRGVRADAQRDREHGGEREPGRLPEGPERVAEVLRERLHGRGRF